MCVKVFATELPADGQSAVKLKVVKGRQMQVCVCVISLFLSTPNIVNRIQHIINNTLMQ